MKKLKYKNLFSVLVILKLLSFNYIKAEPYIILEYSNQESQSMNSEGNFTNNENYSLFHTIKKNETLSNIIEKYYSSGAFNLKFVQAAIVHKNRHAFVRSNPNFMFAGRKLHLPSINEIKNLVYKNRKAINTFESQESTDLYFFGN